MSEFEYLSNGWRRDLFTPAVAREELKGVNRRVNRARDDLEKAQKMLMHRAGMAVVYGGMSEEEVWKLIDENATYLEVDDAVELERKNAE